MDELAGLLAKLRMLDRHSSAQNKVRRLARQALPSLRRDSTKAHILSKINRARQDLVTTIRMEAPNIVYEQARVAARRSGLG